MRCTERILKKVFGIYIIQGTKKELTIYRVVWFALLGNRRYLIIEIIKYGVVIRGFASDL